MSFIGDLERFFAEFIFPYRVTIGIGLALALTALAFLAWRRRWDRPLRRHPGRTLAVVVPDGGSAALRPLVACTVP